MKKILLIEDNEDIRENTAEILELANYKVFTAENGKRGAEIANEELPDLVICDIMMPVLDGYGVLHILSKRPETHGIPFIFLTAKAEKSEIRRGMNLGADDYITKPFDETELLDAIESRLKRSEAIGSEYRRDLNGLDSFINDARGTHDLKELSKERRTRLYKKRKDIFLEGDRPQSVFYINSGKVKTYKLNEDAKELITGIYTEGDFLGYESLLEGQYKVSASALEETELALIPKEDFFTLLFSNRQVAKKFIEILSNKVTEKEQQLLVLAYDTVRQRTANALLEVYEKYGGDDSNPVAITISRDDLAHLVGTATETLIRVLSDFKEEKLIEINSGKITLGNLKKIKTIAERNFAL